MNTYGDFAHLKLKKNGKDLYYKSKLVHIHTPSEHTVDGKHFDAEIHLIFDLNEKKSDETSQKFAVFGFLMDSSKKCENEAITDWKIERELNEDFYFSLASLGEEIENKDFYFYDGSFTSPGCDEIVN